MKAIESKECISFEEFARLNKVKGYKPGTNQSLILQLQDDSVAFINVSSKVDKKSNPKNFNVLLNGKHNNDWLVNKGADPKSFTML